MLQMFIGLGDILTGDPSNDEILSGPVRQEVYLKTIRKLNYYKYLKVEFLLKECLHLDLNCFLDHILKIRSEWSKIDAFIFNSMVHHVDLHSHEKNLISNYIAQVNSLFNFSKQGLPLTWATGPSYDVSRVPLQFLNRTRARPTVTLNLEAIELAKKYRIPLLDFYTMTDRCLSRNCTSDGGHRSRYVNRMKAQMLLNNLCG